MTAADRHDVDDPAKTRPSAARTRLIPPLTRREVLTSTVTGAFVFLSGCSGDDEPDPSPEEICTDEGVPHEDLSPETLIPDAPGGWTMVQEPRGVDTTWPADESSYAKYEDPDARNYTLTVGKFDTSEEATDVVSEEDYTDEIEGAAGVFGVRVTGDGQVEPPDSDRAEELALSVPCVDEGDMVT